MTALDFAYMLENRVGAAIFGFLSVFLVSYVSFRMASKRADRLEREAFWRKAAVLAEFSASFGVVVVVVVAAQYFANSEHVVLQRTADKAVADRREAAFLLTIETCKVEWPPEASFVERSAIVRLCSLSLALYSTEGPAPADKIFALNVGNPGPKVLIAKVAPRLCELTNRLRFEAEAFKRLRRNEVDNFTRPGESDVLVVIVAGAVLFGAALKLGRAVSEFWHRRGEV